MNLGLQSCESVLRTCTYFHIFVNRKILFTSVLHIKVDRPLSSTESPKVRSWKNTTGGGSPFHGSSLCPLWQGMIEFILKKAWKCYHRAFLCWTTSRKQLNIPKAINSYLGQRCCYCTRFFWCVVWYNWYLQYLEITRGTYRICTFMYIYIYRCVYSRAKSKPPPPSHLFVSPFRQVTAHTKPDTILAECRAGKKKKHDGDSIPWICGWMTV